MTLLYTDASKKNKENIDSRSHPSVTNRRKSTIQSSSSSPKKAGRGEKHADPTLDTDANTAVEDNTTHDLSASAASSTLPAKYCSVQEFSAPSEHTYMPTWMMEVRMP